MISLLIQLFGGFGIGILVWTVGTAIFIKLGWMR